MVGFGLACSLTRLGVVLGIVLDWFRVRMAVYSKALRLAYGGFGMLEDADVESC